MRDSVLEELVILQNDLIANCGGFKEGSLNNCLRLEFCVVNPGEVENVDYFMFNENMKSAKQIIDLLTYFTENAKFENSFFEIILMFRRLDKSGNNLELNIFKGLDLQQTLFIIEQIQIQILIYELDEVSKILVDLQYEPVAD